MCLKHPDSELSRLLQQIFFLQELVIISGMHFALMITATNSFAYRALFISLENITDGYCI
jgi:hypothetical protein